MFVPIGNEGFADTDAKNQYNPCVKQGKIYFSANRLLFWRLSSAIYCRLFVLQQMRNEKYRDIVVAVSRLCIASGFCSFQKHYRSHIHRRARKQFNYLHACLGHKGFY